jgi:uncharacterized protein (TIGR02246 family)
MSSSWPWKKSSGRGSSRPTGGACCGVAIVMVGAVLGGAWPTADAVGQTVEASAAGTRQADEEAIRAAAKRYEEALERGDGPALAAFWTADGDIVDDHGTVSNGRKTVATTPPRDKESHPRVEIREKSLRFLAADVAVEDGTVAVTPPGAARPLSGWFTALWKKVGGDWKLAGLRESRIESPADAPKLADLEWMVGEWTAVEEHPDRGPAAAADAASPASPAAARPAIDVSVRWDAGRGFLLREMTIAGAGRAPENGGERPPLRLMQRIGWDPLARQIRSWSFSSDGGHGEGVWSRDGDAWIARTTAVMPDGTQTSSINIYAADGPDRCRWRSIPTHVGGEHAPHVSMTLVRKKGEQPR